ncbi:MAG TPA: carboxyltransferase domain-containing protein, partial [Isosphaeraceae bacterium]|nr:carboxyltransferase domain-containing protein [Isosphaeraceae bacterium]
EDVRTIHAGSIYPIRAIGFLPGFPYCGPLPEPLDQMGRRDSPRPRVPAGSVAIAAGQTAIYPRESPGGWHLLGRTPLVIADLETGYFPLKAGDRIRFQPIDETTFHRLEGQRFTPD